MNFDLSETQELFRTTTERFTQNIDVAARTEMRASAEGYDKSRWSELCELGLLAVALPEEQGGLDGSITDLSVIAQTLGSSNALDPWMENGIFPVSLLSKADNNSAFDSPLESLVDGSKIAAVAFVEPHMRYELKPKLTSATKTNGGYSLNGEKQFVMGGVIADYLLVTAAHDNKFCLFCISVDCQGIETQTYRLADGSLGTAITLTNCQVPENALTGVDFDQFSESITEMSLLCSAEMVGLGELLFNQTLDYVKERKQFGVAIGSFQVIQHGLVDCYGEVEQMKAMLLSLLLAERDAPEQWRADVMGAKSFIADAANFVAERAVQYHGAMGTTDEVIIGHGMKRIITLSRLFGDSTHNLNQYMECA